MIPLGILASSIRTVLPDELPTTYDVITSSDNYLVPDGVTEVDVLIVAGGGGGGSRQGGGGGAGGLRVVRTQVVPGETVPVIVGLGGSGGTNGGTGLNGQPSTFGTYTTLGGGGGGGRSVGGGGRSGGSGGGSGGGETYSDGYLAGGEGTHGQGRNGGHIPTASIYVNAAGGGGGSSEPGGNQDYMRDRAGSGGSGFLFPSLQVLGLGDNGGFGGGGGGGSWARTYLPGQGGFGGGGAGTGLSEIGPPVAGFPGVPNTGGGGGGSNDAEVPGGAGGSGIVVVCFPVGGLNPTLPDSAISALRALTVTI